MNTSPLTKKEIEAFGRLPDYVRTKLGWWRITEFGGKTNATERLCLRLILRQQELLELADNNAPEFKEQYEAFKKGLK